MPSFATLYSQKSGPRMGCTCLEHTVVATPMFGTSQQPICDIYTAYHKKRDILFLTITLANLNRFL